MLPSDPNTELRPASTSSSQAQIGSAVPRGDLLLSHRGRLPIHLQISEMLAREIKAGILLDGERLEPERSMAQRLGIAVGTLRKALADLDEKGLLERVQGSGNYVRNIDDNNTIYGFFKLELLSGGGLPTAIPIAVDRITGDPDITFGRGDSYYRVRRLRRLSNIDSALEEIWLDASYATKEIELSDVSESLYQFYKEDLGFWIARVEDSITVQAPPSWQPADYAPNAGSIWGFVERRGWDQNGDQVEYSRTWFDASSTRFVSRNK